MTDNHFTHKKDPYYKKAKREGYRARSSYKLLDIQKRFEIFKRTFYILDLGCAPGSWLQVTKKFTEENIEKYKDQYYNRDHYKIMGVDIKKVSPIEDVKIIKADITKLEVQEHIDAFFQDKLDLILSDTSITKIGNKFTDHINQIKLCDKILELAKRNLKFKGKMVLKSFLGNDSEDFTRRVKSQFRIVKGYKPQSSKKRSNEIYLICLGKK